MINVLLVFIVPCLGLRRLIPTDKPASLELFDMEESWTPSMPKKYHFVDQHPETGHILFRGDGHIYLTKADAFRKEIKELTAQQPGFTLQPDFQVQMVPLFYDGPGKVDKYQQEQHFDTKGVNILEFEKDYNGDENATRGYLPIWNAEMVLRDHHKNWEQSCEKNEDVPLFDPTQLEGIKQFTREIGTAMKTPGKQTVFVVFCIVGCDRTSVVMSNYMMSYHQKTLEAMNRETVQVCGRGIMKCFQTTLISLCSSLPGAADQCKTTAKCHDRTQAEIKQHHAFAPKTQYCDWRLDREDLKTDHPTASVPSPVQSNTPSNTLPF